MATPVELPKLGNTVEECLVTRWIKRKGESVSAGDVVAEIETDKTTFDVTAPVAGTVLEIFVEEGAVVPVFTKLCIIGNPGESVSPPISPRARRFAAEHDVDSTSIVGSGPGGRVIERDVQRAHAAATTSPAAQPVSRIRETIARRMRESLASTAQYTMHASADASGLVVLRARIKASLRLRSGQAPGVQDITINHLVTFCTIRALLEARPLNAEFIEGRIVERSEVHIGFACDTPKGLMVPVVRNAQTLSIRELALRMDALTTQAVEGTIAADDLSGATFTISNLGSLGVESFTPLINLPQVAILGVGALQLKPVRTKGTVEFIEALGLSLTCDHQAIDGAPGARFLQVIREKIERIELMCPIE
ncbi:MAG: 2-oxo acid dehydrogenase subunit E2 [Acidobacteria bacterium]|nr:MAG: 2-oxo acid dehydrogenase subunit E2 [Acidobacteriota bacterium]